MNETQLPTVATWLAEPLTKDVAQSLDRLRRAEDVRYVAVMPDVHLAADVCVGTVVATRELVYPAAIGGDIGCGMAAVAADADATLFANGQSAAKLLRGLAACVPGNKHSAKRPLTAELVAIGLSDPQLLKAADRDGRVQLGTLGRGNHFLEFQSDDEDRLWIMLHSGSRAMGQSITRFHLERARSPHSRLPALEARSQAGAAYLHDVTWARAYAAASRTAMLHATEELLLQLFHVATDWTTLIHTDHNHVELETHFAEPWLVHRKGAQRAAEGATAVIPGSMGTASYHVVGRGAERALDSCSHGAGRRMSRGEASHRVSARDLLRQMKTVWFDERRAASLRDEAPAAYKDIRQVLRAQRDLVRITRELRPLVSYKGVG